MTHVIRYRELPEGVAVETRRETDGTLVIVVNSLLPHAEQRAAVATALRAGRHHGILCLPLLLLATLHEVLCGTAAVGYRPPAVQPRPPAVVLVIEEIATARPIRRSTPVSHMPEQAHRGRERSRSPRE